VWERRGYLPEAEDVIFHTMILLSSADPGNSGKMQIQGKVQEGQGQG